MFVIIGFSACKTAQYAKYTSTDRLYQLPLGSSYETTVQTLGCEPYDLLSVQQDGYSIYTYKYKVVERRIDPNVVNERGSETAGEEVYRGKEEEAFLFFENNKLVSILTAKGIDRSNALVMFNNTLYKISKNASGDYIILPTSLETTREAPVLQIGKRK